VGKSSVTKQLRKERIAVVDLDAIAGEVVRKGRWAYRRLVAKFGTQILQDDGELDRAGVRAKMTKDGSFRKKLNQATHFPIACEMACQIFQHWRRGARTVVLDAPLLFEAGLYRLTSTVVTVSCSGTTQVGRLMQRDGMSTDGAQQMIGCQMPLEIKCRRADIVLDNDSDLLSLQEKTKELVWALDRAPPPGLPKRVALCMTISFGAIVAIFSGRVFVGPPIAHSADVDSWR